MQVPKEYNTFKHRKAITHPDKEAFILLHNQAVRDGWIPLEPVRNTAINPWNFDSHQNFFSCEYRAPDPGEV